MRFFTSDWHLNSSNILEYAHRPFKTAAAAKSMLISNCNSVASKLDTVFHVGDFCLVGKDRHDKKVDNADVKDFKQVLQQINANFVLMSGNHDDGHNCKTALKFMMIDLNHNYRNVTVAHHPTFNNKTIANFAKLNRNFGAPHIHLCGHVHDKWLIAYDKTCNALNLNIGCDVWKYTPVSDIAIINMLDYFKSAKLIVPTKMSVKQHAQWKIDNEKAIATEREARKIERYKRKGLTPEECERRRLAAMAAKSS